MATCDEQTLYWNLASFFVPFILFVISDILGSMKNPPFEAKSVTLFIWNAFKAIATAKGHAPAFDPFTVVTPKPVVGVGGTTA